MTLYQYIQFLDLIKELEDNAARLARLQLLKELEENVLKLKDAVIVLDSIDSFSGSAYK